MINILLVDDDARLCRAWERMFQTQGDVRLVATRSQAGGLDDAVAETGADLVVLDLTMPGLDPRRAIRGLTSAHPAVRVAVYSGHSDADTIQEVHDAGAHAFIDKLTNPLTMLDILRRVADGESVFPPAILHPGHDHPL